MSLRFLIVDDTRFMRLMLTDILRRLHHEVAGEADNGERAVAMYRELKPDIVFMDISMPGMDGLKALELILREDPKANIIICSAVSQQDLIESAMERGAKGYVMKPFKPKQIREVVAQVSGRAVEVEPALPPLGRQGVGMSLLRDALGKFGAGWRESRESGESHASASIVTADMAELRDRVPHAGTDPFGATAAAVRSQDRPAARTEETEKPAGPAEREEAAAWKRWAEQAGGRSQTAFPAEGRMERTERTDREAVAPEKRSELAERTEPARRGSEAEVAVRADSAGAGEKPIRTTGQSAVKAEAGGAVRASLDGAGSAEPDGAVETPAAGNEPELQTEGNPEPRTADTASDEAGSGTEAKREEKETASSTKPAETPGEGDTANRETHAAEERVKAPASERAEPAKEAAPDTAGSSASQDGGHDAAAAETGTEPSAGPVSESAAPAADSGTESTDRLVAENFASTANPDTEHVSPQPARAPATAAMAEKEPGSCPSGFERLSGCRWTESGSGGETIFSAWHAPGRSFLEISCEGAQTGRLRISLDALVQLVDWARGEAGPVDAEERSAS